MHLLDSLNAESALTTHEGTIGSMLYSTKFQGKHLQICRPFVRSQTLSSESALINY